MAWIESHQTLLRHPKLLKLARLIGVDNLKALGMVHAFWYWVLDYAPTGNLSEFTSIEIGSSVSLDGEAAESFLNALIEVGFIDRHGKVTKVHDWPDYAGRYLLESRFKRHSDKKKEMCDLYRIVSMDSPRTSRGQSEDSPRFVHGLSKVPDLTLPNHTIPNQPNPPEGSAEGKSSVAKAPQTSVCDGDWLKSLEGSPAYKGIDVPREFEKMRLWCQSNKKNPSRRRLINWLNRVERPMEVNGSAVPESQRDYSSWNKPFVSQPSAKPIPPIKTQYQST